jgi:NhaA family Na+:H+ antiporter
MSIFITLLAFGDTELAQSSKLAVILGSLSAGVIGYILLYRQATIATKKRERASPQRGKKP